MGFFPGSRGRVEDGVNGSVWELCDVSVAGLFVTCEILGWVFVFVLEDLGGLIQHYWGTRLNLYFVF